MLLIQNIKMDKCLGKCGDILTLAHMLNSCVTLSNSFTHISVFLQGWCLILAALMGTD